ncbi:MAG: calcium-binding protein, partial [Cypionkella sp.]|nr:calcium-binding protein [Cypionkella sp.]
MKRILLLSLYAVASFGLAAPVAAQQAMMDGQDGMMGGSIMSGMNSYAMRMFDADKDGTLTPEEMTAGMQAEIKTYDTDSNGSLSLAEFEAMHA